MITINIPEKDINKDELKEITIQLRRIFQCDAIIRNYDTKTQTYRITLISPKIRYTGKPQNNHTETKENSIQDTIQEYLNTQQNNNEKIQQIQQKQAKEQTTLETKLAEHFQIPTTMITIHGDKAFITTDYISNKFIQNIKTLQKHYYIDLKQGELAIHLSQDRQYKP